MKVRIILIGLMVSLLLIRCSSAKSAIETQSDILYPCKLYGHYVGPGPCRQSKVTIGDTCEVLLTSPDSLLLARFTLADCDSILSTATLYKEDLSVKYEISYLNHPNLKVVCFEDHDIGNSVQLRYTKDAANGSLELSPSGLPRAIHTYSDDGTPYGWTTSWDDKGRLLSHECIGCGKTPYHYYHIDGSVAISATVWNSTLFFVRDYREYFENGQLKTSGQYNDPDEMDASLCGKIGVWIEYDSLGVEVSRFDYGQIDR